MNHQLEQLAKNLLAQEQDEARNLFNAARSVGLGPIKAAALCYRAGRLAGRKECAQKMKAAYKQLQAARDRIAGLESSIETTFNLATLINNPEPNRDIDDIIAHTPGDETEDAEHE